MPADPKPRAYRADDRVRVTFVTGGTVERTLTRGGALDLNEGENPWHPWRFTKIELIKEAPDAR
jgi:hypothetical protein